MGEQCIRNDDSVLAVSDEDNKTAGKNYILNTEFTCDKNNLPKANVVSGQQLTPDWWYCS